MGPLLVVEDNALMARRLERVAKAYAPVLVSVSAREAESHLLAAEPLAGAIIDVALPDGNGLDLLAKARPLRPGLPAVVLTGICELETVQRAQRLGALYLTKDHCWTQLEAFLRALPASAHWLAVRDVGRRYALTDHEMDVLAYLLASAQVRAMRGRLGVSKNTLKSETRRLLLKCQARDATALLAKLSARGPEPAR